MSEDTSTSQESTWSNDKPYSEMWIDKLAVIYPPYSEPWDDKGFLADLFEWMDDSCPGWAVHNSPSQWYHWHGSHAAQQAVYRQQMLTRGDMGGHFRIASEEHLVLCILRWPDMQVIDWYRGSL